MTISAVGVYGPTLAKLFTNAAALDVETAADLKIALLLDTYDPDYDAHDFYADLSAHEVAGVGYVAGGVAPGNPTFALQQPAAGKARWTIDDLLFDPVTVDDVKAAVAYFDGVANELLALTAWATPLDAVAGPISIDITSGGFFNLDYTP